MPPATCESCGKRHKKRNGVVTVTGGKELRFCSEGCRTVWKKIL